MMNYDLSEDTIREFLEALIEETKAQNIIWGKSPKSNPIADLEENQSITLLPRDKEFRLSIPNVSPQRYILQEEESKSIFNELCELAMKPDQFKTNKFILDFIKNKSAK